MTERETADRIEREREREHKCERDDKGKRSHSERERENDRKSGRARARESDRERERVGGGDLLTTFGWGEGGDLLTTFGHVCVGRVNDFGAGFAVPTDKIKNVPLLIVW